MKNKLTIVKIGGNVIDDGTQFNVFLNNFKEINHKKILVHGGGKIATKIAEKLGIKATMHEGRRITSQEFLEVATMVYAGLINKKITAALQHKHINSIGLSGTDANTILSKKRKIDTTDFGFVGDIEKVNTEMIEIFLSQNLCPVFCAITYDKYGQLLNTNADSIASEIAIAMSQHYETHLLYCFEKKGILADINHSNSLISHINTEKYKILKSKGVINEGMIPKIDNAFQALRHNVHQVIIGDINAIKKNNKNHTLLTI